MNKIIKLSNRLNVFEQNIKRGKRSKYDLMDRKELEKDILYCESENSYIKEHGEKVRALNRLNQEAKL